MTLEFDTARAASRLALGTAQFGADYGIANFHGRPPEMEVALILGRAMECGIDVLDTAIAYGDAEALIGRIGVQGFRIISKLPSLPHDLPAERVRDWVRSSVEGSLQRLHVDRLDGLLLHRPRDLTDPRGPELAAAVTALKDSGIALKVGVSIYKPRNLEMWREAMPLDIVQSPFNVLDRRLAIGGWLHRLTGEGIEVHARSAFLQGLLVMGTRPRWTNAWMDVWSTWEEWLSEHDISPVHAALGFVLSHRAIDRVVVGVDSLRQLNELVVLSSLPTPAPPDEIACGDEALIDPSLWPASVP